MRCLQITLDRKLNGLLVYTEFRFDLVIYITFSFNLNQVKLNAAINYFFSFMLC